MEMCRCHLERCHICADTIYNKNVSDLRSKRDEDYRKAEKEYTDASRKALDDYRRDVATLDREREENMKKVTYNPQWVLYSIFTADRVREPVTVEEMLECRANPIKTKRLLMILSRWKKENHYTALSINECLALLETRYGCRIGENWVGIKVFSSDEDAKHWDAAHSAPPQ